MIWQWTDDHDWKRRFALLPIFLSDGPNKSVVWLQWVWKRDRSQYIEVSLTDPRARLALTSPRAVDEGTKG